MTSERALGQTMFRVPRAPTSSGGVAIATKYSVQFKFLNRHKGYICWWYDSLSTMLNGTLLSIKDAILRGQLPH